ncbi:flavoprotein [Streptomyces sp. NPDC002526]
MAERPVVHLVGCGSRPTGELPAFATALEDAGWAPYLVPTPVGLRFLDAGQAVHSESDPDAPVELPQADAVVVAPATYNTVVKLAAGIADTLALSVAADAIGGGAPVIVVPWTNDRLAAHPVFAPAVETLRRWGVRVLPADQAEPFPWAAVREALLAARPRR